MLRPEQVGPNVGLNGQTHKFHDSTVAGVSVRDARREYPVTHLDDRMASSEVTLESLALV
jgi:hypothetical protein